MKPRDGWTIAPGGAGARRTDGVSAGFYFLGADRPYGVKRFYQSPKKGRVEEFLRPAGSLAPRRFRTLDAAMVAADNWWPPQ